MVNKNTLRRCAFGKENILNGVTEILLSIPPMKSSQTSQPGLRPCYYATVLKSALHRAKQNYKFYAWVVSSGS